MATPVLQLGCTIQCIHGGRASVMNTNNRVKVDGNYALLATDKYTISGCPFYKGDDHHPCVKIEWQNEAKKVKVKGKPVLLQNSIGICKAQDGLVQGTAIISGVQNRVRGL